MFPGPVSLMAAVQRLVPGVDEAALIVAHLRQIAYRHNPEDDCLLVDATRLGDDLIVIIKDNACRSCRKRYVRRRCRVTGGATLLDDRPDVRDRSSGAGRAAGTRRNRNSRCEQDNYCNIQRYWRRTSLVPGDKIDPN